MNYRSKTVTLLCGPEGGAYELQSPGETCNNSLACPSDFDWPRIYLPDASNHVTRVLPYAARIPPEELKSKKSRLHQKSHVADTIQNVG